MEKIIASIKCNRENLKEIKRIMLEFSANLTPMALRNFFVRCNKQGILATVLAYHTMRWLVEAGRSELVESTYATTPDENDLYGVYCIGQSFVDFKKHALSSGASRLREGLYRCLRCDGKDVPERDLLMRNAFLLEQVEWSEEAGEEQFTKPKLEIVRDNRLDGAGRTWCAAFDRSHYERFFGRFVTSVRDNDADADIVAILINCGDELLEAAAEFGHVSVACVQYEGEWPAEFRRHSPILFAADILGGLESQVVFVDSSAVVTKELAAKMGQVTGISLGVCDTGEIVPTGMIDTRLIVSRRSKEALAFWHMVERFVLSGFARKGPLGGLCEIGLLVASRDAEKDGFRMTVLNDPEKKDCLSEFLRGLDADDLSLVGMETTDRRYKLTSITAERRIVVAEKCREDGVDPHLSRHKKIVLPWSVSDGAETLLRLVVSEKYGGVRSLNEVLAFSDKVGFEGLNVFFKKLFQTKIGWTCPMDLALFILSRMTWQGKSDQVNALFEASDENTPLFGLYSIGQSFDDFRNWEVESGAQHMREGSFHCWRSEIGVGSSFFHFVLRNIFLLENLKWPTQKRFSMPPYRIVYNNRSEGSPYTCCLVSDPKYFDRYWDLVIHDFRVKCPDIDIFLTLINPTDDIISRAVGAYRGEHLTVARIEYTGEYLTEFCHLTYYLMFYEAMKITGKPVVTIETDALFPHDIKDALDAITECPLGYADDKDPYPLTRLEGSTLCGYPSEDTFAFWDMVADNMLAYLMMDGPRYSFNQMALYVAVCKGRKVGWKMTDINEILQGKQRYYFKGGEPLSLEEKKAARVDAKYIDFEMTKEGKVLFKKKMRGHKVI